MRDGQNPGKSQDLSGSVGKIRVVMPVFVPSIDGYFEQALSVLDVCLESLRVTTDADVRVTVVANGCCPEVEANLAARVESGSIDELIVHRHNLGKVDAVLSGARSTYEDVIVLTDCDVLFRPGWVDAMLDMFRHFPECGFLGLTPLPNVRGYATSTATIEARLRRELTTAAVVDRGDFKRFADSIGRPEIVDEFSGQQFIVRRRGRAALLGAGHFCYATRRVVLTSASHLPSHGSPSAETDWLDLPPDRDGYWRISTPAAYALHMGNCLEDWMLEELNLAKESAPCGTANCAIPPAKRSLLAGLPYRLRVRVGRRVLSTHSTVRQ